MENQELVQMDEGNQDEKIQLMALPVDGLELLVTFGNQPPFVGDGSEHFFRLTL